MQYASDRVDELWILVCQKKSYQLSPILRASWIEKTFPKARVLVIPADHLSDDDSRGWAAYTKQVLGFTPDIVFSSEDYGPMYAEYMGATHVMVDRERKHIPISGTLVRSHVLSHLDMLPRAVVGDVVGRISIVGAESTGTTTLARDLAAFYQTNWVPEYGRLYSSARDSSSNPWESSEFIHIAQMQQMLEDKLAQTANKVLFCDTDVFATSIWHEAYMDTQSFEVESLARTAHYDLHLLTDIENVPFDQDGTRDKARRATMHKRFIEKLTEWKIPFVIVTGSPQERVTHARCWVDTIIAQKSIPHP